jgi:hypothetical protein
MSDAPEAAQRRSANFFRGTMCDTTHEPDAAGSTEHLETVALAAIKTNLEAHAQSLGRTLPGADLSNMLKAAQSYLRRLPREQLAGFNSSNSLMSAITKESFAAAPVMDPKGAALTAAQSQSGGSEQSNIIAGRFRESFERATLNSSQRYAAMVGENFSQADTAKIAAAMGVARDYGMTWMNPRDLLLIGPAGVKAIADVNLMQDSYQRLRTDGRFEAKDVVTLADYAKAKGIKDANHLANTTSNEVQLGKDEAEKQRIKQLEVGYMAAAAAALEQPNDAGAQQKLDEAAQQRKALLTPVAGRSQHHYDTIKAQEDAMKMRAQDRVTTQKLEAKADVKMEKADVKVVKADAKEKTKEDLDLYAQAAAPDTTPANKPDPGKQADVGKAAPSTTQTAAAPVPPKQSAPKLS